jgi:hypothetical protein
MTNIIGFPEKVGANDGASMMTCDCAGLDEEYKGWAAVMVNHPLGGYLDRLVCLKCYHDVKFDRGMVMP